jgi:hypothetical protein
MQDDSMAMQTPAATPNRANGSFVARPSALHFPNAISIPASTVERALFCRAILPPQYTYYAANFQSFSETPSSIYRVPHGQKDASVLLGLKITRQLAIFLLINFGANLFLKNTQKLEKKCILINRIRRQLF